MPADLLNDLITVFTGQHQVDDNDIVHSGQGPLQAFFPSPGYFHFIAI